MRGIFDFRGSFRCLRGGYRFGGWERNGAVRGDGASAKRRKNPGPLGSGFFSYVVEEAGLAKKEAWFPTDAFGGGAELFQGAVLDLADALLADAE